MIELDYKDITHDILAANIDAYAKLTIDSYEHIGHIKRDNLFIYFVSENLIDKKIYRLSSLLNKYEYNRCNGHLITLKILVNDISAYKKEFMQVDKLRSYMRRTLDV